MAELGVTTEFDLEVEVGSDHYIPFEVQATLLAALGESTIAGYTTVFTITDDYDDPTVTETINGDITDAAAREGQFHVPNATLTGLGVGNFLHNAWRLDADFNFCLGKGAYRVVSALKG